MPSVAARRRGAAEVQSPNRSNSLRTFARCLRSHGLDVPDPDPATGLIPLEELAKINRSSQEFKDAEAACRDLAARVPAGAAQRMSEVDVQPGTGA